ncbi:venom protease-like [Ornithodoros turicata]|uniref:venom protease-like n=1 Tax=Ornithodoros turicata TaxID=34597 RepID=UPI00313950A6
MRVIFIVYAFWKPRKAQVIVFSRNACGPICPTVLSEYHRRKRIVGGRAAELLEYPYAVSIRKKLKGSNSKPFPFCGGALITERHVLTAAHCLNKKSPKILSVNIGDYNFASSHDTENHVRAVPTFRQHEEYDVPSYRNDIAIVYLNESVSLLQNSLETAILPPLNSDITPGTVARVVGWGRLRYGGPKSSILRKVDIPVVNRTICQRPLKHRIYPLMVCAGGIEGKDACIGDSGGPMLIQVNSYHVVAGVVSFGKKCALKDVYGVYTRLGLYGPWIYRNTIDAECKPAFTVDRDYPWRSYEGLDTLVFDDITDNIIK